MADSRLGKQPDNILNLEPNPYVREASVSLITQ